VEAVLVAREDSKLSITVQYLERRSQQRQIAHFRDL
jgi:hypothetical protein